MEMPTLLVATLFLPLGGAIFLALAPGLSQRMSRMVALLVATVTLVMAVFLMQGFPGNLEAGEVFAEAGGSWLRIASGSDIQFRVGLDGLSLWLFGLSSLLMLTAVLVSWEAIVERAALFYSMLLLLECGCLGVFAAQDIILFYIFFEFTLIPLFFLIGIWGSEDRRYAAIKFFLFTFTGSVLTFLGLLALVGWVYHESGRLTFSIAELTTCLQEGPLPFSWQVAVFLALFAGFAIKVPLFPLHTWLPLAHVQAPTAGSVILAGVLLKIGTYGFIRFSLPMLPAASAAFMPWILGLALVGIIYGALVALVQRDIKRLIAYSSVSHLGFCMLGMFSLNRLGLSGSVLQMINHGISTGALFALVGMLYERYHTREISQLGGLTRRLPILTFFMLIFTMSSIGLPGLNGFTGEILVLLGVFQRAWMGAPAGYFKVLILIAVLSVFGVVLGAWYMLWLVQRVFFGPLKEPPRTTDEQTITDLNFREILALAPLSLMVLWIGLQPSFFLRHIDPFLAPVVSIVQQNIDNDDTEPDRIADHTSQVEVDNLRNRNAFSQGDS
ncbi:MAG: proton-translocating NADH-quinone oxidoreductase subunit M [Planctomycetaceae bacterium]|nr:proton-translocating NADH-quinone oxidoreductase subunit M [Planctomycetaceae bacterium]MBP60374.1 proton-translocating NADH-quinone oxidoreductase subunit M [Planctomycetaceae bacterium]